MKFNFDCRHCSRTAEAEWAWIGKTITCSSCGQPILVPAPMETAGRESKKVEAPSRDQLKFRCQDCGRRYTTRPDLAGKKILCGGCGAKVRIPKPGTVSASGNVAAKSVEPQGGKHPQAWEAKVEEAARYMKVPKMAPPQAEEDDTDSDFEPDTEFHIDPDSENDTETETRPAPTQKATTGSLRTLDDDGFPSKVAMAGDRVERPADGDTVFAEIPAVPAAVARGSRSLLQRINDYIFGSPPEKMDDIEQQLADQARAKIKEQRDRERSVAKILADTELGGGMIMSDVVNILIGAIVAMLVIGVVCWRYSHQSFLIGALVAIVGAFIYLQAVGRFARVARAESTNCSIACKFVPFYKWYYLCTRWHEMKAHFVFICVGMMIFWQGVLILAVSTNPLQASTEEKAASDPVNK